MKIPDRPACRRDEFGIPFLRADSLTELAYEQGQVMASDRAWQLDIGRRLGEGTCAALVGAGAVAWDAFARRIEIAEVAQRNFAALSGPTQEFLASFVAGVNDGFRAGASSPEHERLGAAPQPWSAWSPLAVFEVNHIHFGAYPDKLWAEHVLDRLGPKLGAEVLALLRTEEPGSGSNAFAISGERTASGFPIVAGDPHRSFEFPNVYAQIGLATPDFDVVGFCFPGVPGIQHFGHAGTVAWGITNAMADTQDLFVEELTRTGDSVTASVPTRVTASGPAGPEPVRRTVAEIEVATSEMATSEMATSEMARAESVVVEVLETARGHLIDDRHSLRRPPAVIGSGFETLVPLLHARTNSDVIAAFAHWVEPVNNLVVADRSGAIAHRVVGRLPQRHRAHRLTPQPALDPARQWTGWVTELPHLPDGATEVVTANQRVTPAFDVLSDEFAAPYRAERISQLLGERTELTPADALAVLGDTAPNAAALLRLLPDDPAAARLRAWAGAEMGLGSAEAARFAALRERVVELLCTTSVLAELSQDSPSQDSPSQDSPSQDSPSQDGPGLDGPGPLHEPWFAIGPRVAVCLDAILADPAPFGLDPAALVAQAWAEVGTADLPAWGAEHRYTAAQALTGFGLAGADLPATQLPGDWSSVNATGSAAGGPWAGRGPVARYVWDLSPTADNRWVVPMGAAGDPTDPTHDAQHPIWAAGSATHLNPPRRHR